MKLVFAKAAERDRVDAWLERDGSHWPLRRIGEEPEPITLPGAPTIGAEAGPARWFAERLEDVRIAAALLQAAAEHVDLAVNTTRHIKFLPLAAQPEWVRRLIVMMEPLKRVIESCAAFEDVLAAAPPCEENASTGNTLLPGGVLPNEMRDISADIARRASFAVPIAREDQIIDRRVTPGVGSVAPLAALPDEKALETIAKAVETAEAARPHIEAADRFGPALAQAEAVRRHVAAIDRAAPLIAAVDALGPDARLAPLTSSEAKRGRNALDGAKSQIAALDRAARAFDKMEARTSARALSAAELADLDRIDRQDVAFPRLAEVHKQKDPH